MDIFTQTENHTTMLKKGKRLTGSDTAEMFQYFCEEGVVSLLSLFEGLVQGEPAESDQSESHRCLQILCLDDSVVLCK